MPSAPDVPASPPSTPETRHAGHLGDRRTFVLVMIAIAILLFVATEGLLYYRWATMNEPTCILIIDAAEPLRGAVVSVDGVMLAAAHKVVIGDHDRFAIPFYLEPGRYTIKIKMNDTDLFHAEVDLTREKPGLRMDLRKLTPPPSALLPSTAPTGAPSPSFLP